MFGRNKKATESALANNVKNQGSKGDKSKNLCTPFLRQGGKQDDRYMNLSIEKHNWQVAWQITVAILAVSMAFNGYYMISSKFVPYVVAVDKLGNIISVGVANRANPIDNKRVLREQMINWVEYARLIVGDQAAQKRFMGWVYARVQDNSAAKHALDRFIRERKPFTTAADHTIEAHVTLALPVSDHTYQVEWTETLHAPNGDPIGEERWKGIFTYRTAPLYTDEAIRANGAGFFITHFTWSKVVG